MIDYNFIPDYEARLQAEENLCKKYSFIQKELVGKSPCNREIYAYTIGEGCNKALYVGAFHGMEWLTSLVLIKFLDECCNALENNKNILNFRICDFLKTNSVTIIPCINPDGVEIQQHGSNSCKAYKRMIDFISTDTSRWQANARGVDLNHNFNAGWKALKHLEIKKGITKPAPTRYGGKCPESEPEVINLVNYCRKKNFSKAIAFHSQGREIYWDFGDNTPKNSHHIASVLAESAGYSVSKPSGLAVGGGFKDWFISEFKKPAFTVEIGKGKNPLPLSDFNDEYSRLLPLLSLGIIL